ncbi:VCBS repeat-containing protein [Reichenbachiella sp. MALMAid0571]|uniref:FG-GAP repeat domain-containing protein n=1 Tax=Reichenbachiella sp. MALMAid0571 TaxID=3143939 RepID=UPI0032DF1962
MVTAKSQYNTYCGSCHLAPDPANIPKSVWKNNILPDMASRLGYEFLSPSAESFSFHDQNVFNNSPKLSKAIIDSVTWNLIYGYIMTLSPDSIIQDTLRLKRNLPLDRFDSSPVSFEEYQDKSMITSVQFDSLNNRFFIADALNQWVYQWPFDSTLKSETEIPRFDSPVTSVVQKGNTRWIAEAGYLFPSNQPLGTLYQVTENSIYTVMRNLHRPVFVQIADLNYDFMNEIIVCEFGNRTGQLSMLIKSDQGYKKTNLLAMPGTTKVEIADMDTDGLNDIVVLASQGNEGIYILYNEGDLKFRIDQVIQLPPEYGSSWFQLVDYNKDGHLDIVLTNGDNGDFSVFAKPYHGVRLFINDGSNSFDQEWFYPIYGATRVLSADYDLDGDLDFAVMSFFPDYTTAPGEGFVYLENNDLQRYEFVSYTFEQSLTGRWVVMDHGDFDQDGDVDIMLGSYTLPINKKYNSIMEGWKASRINLQLLKNNAIK